MICVHHQKVMTQLTPNNRQIKDHTSKRNAYSHNVLNFTIYCYNEFRYNQNTQPVTSFTILFLTFETL